MVADSLQFTILAGRIPIRLYAEEQQFHSKCQQYSKSSLISYNQSGFRESRAESFPSQQRSDVPDDSWW